MSVVVCNAMKPKILFLLTAGLFAVSLPATERNTTLSAPEWSAEVRSLLDFESLKGWEGGGEQVSSPVKHGRFAVRWAYDNAPGDHEHAHERVRQEYCSIWAF